MSAERQSRTRLQDPSALTRVRTKLNRSSVTNLKSPLHVDLTRGMGGHKSLIISTSLSLLPMTKAFAFVSSFTHVAQNAPFTLTVTC